MGHRPKRVGLVGGLIGAAPRRRAGESRDGRRKRLTGRPFATSIERRDRAQAATVRRLPPAAWRERGARSRPRVGAGPRRLVRGASGRRETKKAGGNDSRRPRPTPCPFGAGPCFTIPSFVPRSGTAARDRAAFHRPRPADPGGSRAYVGGGTRESVSDDAQGPPGPFVGSRGVTRRCGADTLQPGEDPGRRPPRRSRPSPGDDRSARPPCRSAPSAPLSS